MVNENILRTHTGKKVFSDRKITFVTAYDLIKCLKEMKKKTELAPYMHLFLSYHLYTYHECNGAVTNGPTVQTAGTARIAVI